MARRRHAQRVVSSSDDDQSESETSSSSSSNESAQVTKNQMIDIEASDDEGDSDSESDSSHSDDSLEEDPAFSKFMELPPELRDRVWEYFCPDLTVPQRVLLLRMDVTGWAPFTEPSNPSLRARFNDGLYLSGQTETLRCLSSISRESRHRALRRAPDELRLSGHAMHSVVRFDAAKDILALDVVHYNGSGPGMFEQGGGLAQNIALQFDLIDEEIPWRQIFPQLRTVYNLFDHDKFNDRWLRWCVTDLARKCYYEHIEDAEPAPLTLPYMICFPDAENHPDFIKYSLGRLSKYGLSYELPQEIEDAGLSLQPMIRFGCGSGYREYEYLEQSKNVPLPELPDESPSEREDSDAGGGEPNEYESDGIDDDSIEEADDSSEDELIPDPISPGSGVGTPLSEVSPGQGGRAAANLSSLEPSEDEETPAETTVRRPKRRIVSDSDDDDDDNGAGAGKQQSDGPSRKKRRRVAQALDSDSETETGDPQPATRAVDESESSEETSRSSSSDESEEAPRKPLSLAQRLRAQQPLFPVAAVSDDESDGEQVDDASSVSDDEENDEHRPRRGREFFLDEASESGDDEGEADSFIEDDDDE
ncbi:hypothetical protein LIA77_03181 [Sarocladium implicatum]|nr:hypothetical protein LIA77_03181 [Sarocladium implicatum]